MKSYSDELTLLAGKGKAEEAERVEETATKCLLLFSHTFAATTSTSQLREFECKTCNRRFPSFQALGGHRASHKRLRFVDEEGNEDLSHKPKEGGKPRVHECVVCGLEFSIGQALGGHMRRHRNPHEIIHYGSVEVAKPDRKKVPQLDLNFPPAEEPPCACG